MKFSTVIVLNVAAVAGFLAARRLLADDEDLERLPSPMKQPVAAVRGRLVRARSRARVALVEGRAEQAATERELMSRYREQLHR